MNLTAIQAKQMISDAVGLADLPVLVGTRSGLHFAIDLVGPRPMVCGFQMNAHFVAGNGNCRKYACLETNLAFHPSITQARIDCLTTRALISQLSKLDDGLSLLLRSGFAEPEYKTVTPTYRLLEDVHVVRITKHGRPDYVSRGGMSALVLSTG